MTTSNIVIFTKDQAKAKADLIAKLGSCTTTEQFAEIQEQLLSLNVAENTAKQQRAESIDTIFKQIGALEITFTELLNAGVFSRDTVKTFADEQGWVNTVQVAGASSTSTKKVKPELIVGTFNFEDYGFTMPKKPSGELQGKGETSLTWDWNKVYGGLSWQSKFISAIKAEGWKKLLEKETITNEFKKWLFEDTVSTGVGKGAVKGEKLYKNKREFLSWFGVEGTSKELDAFDLGIKEPVEEVVESVVVQDEFSQEAPVEETAQQLATNKKGKK